VSWRHFSGRPKNGAALDAITKRYFFSYFTRGQKQFDKWWSLPVPGLDQGTNLFLQTKKNFEGFARFLR
jgi:hypothetical protein